MQKISNLEDAMQRLRGYLTQYLKDKGIDTNKNFCCISPKHEDKNPSMTCKQNAENAFCFSCGATADIFQAAHWLDNKPVGGQEFIEQNVMWLAEKYNVPIALEEMTEEDAYRARTYQAYRDAANLIANPQFGNYDLFNEECKRRRWDKDLLHGALVGTVDYKQFREALKSMGYEARFIDDIDLGREEIFDHTNMIFTVCDELGRPVGFSARNLIYTPDKDENNKPKNGSKYMNQKTTGVRCNIYQKGRRLYGLHTAKKNVPPLYVFEGYADVITAWHFGLLNCVAIGGTAFTSQHIDTLKQTGCYNIILCLDGDAAGKQRTIELLDKFFRGQKDMQIGVINMPGDMDPDDLLREKGLDEFLKLKRFSAFEWRLNCYNDDDNPEEICQNMIPLIVGESSCIAQDKMCSDLARFTSIDKKVITSELDRLINARQREKQREKETILEQAFTECRKNPEDTKALLYQCLTQIEQVEEKYDENSFSPESVLEFVDHIRQYEDTKSSEFAGWKLSPLGLGPFGDNLNGNWREDVFVAFGGAANAGKSSLVCQLLWEIASNPANDAIVIYHTIDDSKEQILPRFVVQAYGHHDLSLNHVRNINYYRRYDELMGEAIAARRDTGYQNLRDLISEGKLIIKDAQDGGSLAYGESLIRYYRKKHPSKRIVYALDNLHKASDFDGLKDQRSKYKALSNQFKHIATQFHVCNIATVEYIKLPPGTIPNNNNIAETRSLIYDANLICHMYNDLHERSVEAEVLHEHEGQILPRIRLGYGKNKVTEFKDRIFLDFFPASGIFRAVDTQGVVADIRARRRAARSNQESNREGGSVVEGRESEVFANA